MPENTYTNSDRQREFRNFRAGSWTAGEWSNCPQWIAEPAVRAHRQTACRRSTYGLYCLPSVADDCWSGSKAGADAEPFRCALQSWTKALSLDEVRTRILDDLIGSAERYQEQLCSMSHCSESDWTVTVTYLALTLADAANSGGNSDAWFSGSEPPELNSVDRMIIDYALRRLRAKLGYPAIAFHLLPPNFTLTELQAVYEAVLDRQVDKRNFRRRIHAAGLVEGTGESRREGSHRPARLYRSQTAYDPETYLTPAWSTQQEWKVANP